MSIKKLRQFEVPYKPWGITWLRNTEIVVCGDGPVVHIYTKEGHSVTSINIPASNAWDVTWHDSKLFVTECGTDNGRVFVYNTKLEHIRTINVGYKGAGGIAVTDRNMYVTSTKEHLIYRLDSTDGSDKQIFASSCAGLVNPGFIAANDSHVAVSCFGNYTVIVFSANNTDNISRCEKPGRAPGQLDNPRGVTFDPYDWILISEYYNHRISRVSSAGSYEKNFCIDVDCLSKPQGLAASQLGQVVVGCWTSNATIAVYDLIE